MRQRKCLTGFYEMWGVEIRTAYDGAVDDEADLWRGLFQYGLLHLGHQVGSDALRGGHS